jgi:hypothetical protein
MTTAFFGQSNRPRLGTIPPAEVYGTPALDKQLDLLRATKAPPLGLGFCPYSFVLRAAFCGHLFARYSTVTLPSLFFAGSSLPVTLLLLYRHSALRAALHPLFTVAV